MDAVKEESIGNFMAIASCDREFAMSFLEANGWSLEMAINNFMEPGMAQNAPPAGASGLGDNPANANAAFDAFGQDFMDEPRAPIAQFRDTLIDSDPAARARAPPVASTAANHPLEAFRASSSGDGEAPEEKEVFGLQKRPRNLAEIYAPPTELCFSGSFEELRAAGRKEQKWLLVNIQSPTEFASQQLNADTWRDETLRAVIGSSFLFWQKYYDSPEGSTYCRFYLKNATGPNPVGLPHIAVVDPITAASVKTWTGFKDAERLMDKLMEYADDPPTDVNPFDDDAMAAHAAQQQLSPPKPAGGGGFGGGAAAGSMPSHFQQPSLGDDPMGAGAEDPELAAAIAASLEGGGGSSGGGASAMAAEPTAPSGPSEAEIDAMWGVAADEPADGLALKIRTLDGAQMMRKFSPAATLRDVLVAVHCAGHRLDPSKGYKLAMQFGPTVTDHATTLEAAGVTRGVYNLSEA